MKKFFFISNRQSGKTTKAVYEFMKNPEETILICPNSQSKKDIVKKIGSVSNANNILGSAPSENFFRGKKAKRIIYDEYLSLDYETRLYFERITLPLGIEEIYCFSTPQVLYDRDIFDFVVNMKKENKGLSIEQQSDLCMNDLIIEITDNTIRTSEMIREEIYELFYNYLTDPDTNLIHNDFFINQKISNLNNVSYFPEEYKELTELKGVFLKK